MQSYDVTLTDTNVHNLADLIAAADAAKSSPVRSTLVKEYREIIWTADGDNGAAVLYCGDSHVASTDYAFKLAAGNSITKRHSEGGSRFFTSTIYVKASAQPCRFHLDATA